MKVQKQHPLQSSNSVDIEDILLRPDTYIGSINSYRKEQWVYVDNSMVRRNASYVPGLPKIFNDILETTAEIKQRDPYMNSLKVLIDVEENLISVSHNGEGVPIEIHPEEKVYTPELIFGHLNTPRRDGYGLTLANIFSIKFEIEIADGKRQLKYKQVFSNNMRSISQPDITTCNEGEKWTKVSFKPDLKLFKLNSLNEDIASLMKKRVVDLAGWFGNSVKVELNDHLIQLESFRDYADLYLKSVDKFIPEPLPRIYAKISERCEICVSLSDGEFQQVSFVNSIATLKGGTHVDYVTNQITSYVMNKLNEMKMDADIKADNVKNHLWVFVKVLIDEPAFDSQTKEALTTEQNSFGSKCDVPGSILEEVSNFGIMDTLLSWAYWKKSHGTKTRRVFCIGDLQDALHAGGSHSESCTLILTEGLSTKALAMAGLSAVGRDFYGVFSLGGKLLNVREASIEQILENEEIQNIMEILGLELDKKYTNVKPLRYGHLMIMAERSHDGSHFKGLIISFIHYFWPSLLKVPSFMAEFTAPIIKAFHPDETKSFYSMPKFEQWREGLGNNANGWKIKYYKGLGSSSLQEAKEYFRDLDKHRKLFHRLDEQDGSAIELAFSKEKAEDRKTWICNFEPGTCRDHMAKSIKYRDFVNKELILFFRDDPQNSIASMVDGLKPCQRKVLFCSFKKKLFKEINVGEFSGYVFRNSAYHHGEPSLASTIINMAQDFVGSNNINLLKPKGLFGSRYTGGKVHGSARHLCTELSPITRCLFSEDDDKLLDYLNEYGKSVEPTWFMPVIPMVLVNGSEGIGTWSSFIPNYNPREIIANIRCLLNGEEVVPMDPWYKGFEGSICKSAKEGGYVVNGTIEEVDKQTQTYKITELPIGMWTEDYKRILKYGTPNIFIEEFWQNGVGDSNTVEILVRLKQDKITVIKQEDLREKFKLTSTISTSNMHLFDAKGKIKKYDNPEQILKEFFPLRLEYYERRKKHKLENLDRLLLVLNNKFRFILMVLSGRIVVSNREKADLSGELNGKGFTPMPRKGKSAEPQVNEYDSENDDSTREKESAEAAGDYEYLLSMPVETWTVESVLKLLDEMEKKTRELKILEATSPTSMWMTDLDELEKKLDEAAPKKPPRKTNKVVEPETSNSSVEVVVETEEQPNVPAARKKECGKRAATAKKKSSTVVLDSSDSDNENVVADDDDDQAVASATGKKKRGREPAAENAGIWPKKKVRN